MSSRVSQSGEASCRTFVVFGEGGVYKREGGGGDETSAQFCTVARLNKSMEQGLNLSRSQYKDCSHAYNTPFLS